MLADAALGIEPERPRPSLAVPDIDILSAVSVLLVLATDPASSLSHSS